MSTVWLKLGRKGGKEAWSPHVDLMAVSQDYSVYRVYGRPEQPLYVGSTCDLLRRIEEHKYRSWWWPRAAMIAVTGPYADRPEAEANEANAIRVLQPMYNITKPQPFALDPFTIKLANEGWGPAVAAVELMTAPEQRPWAHRVPKRGGNPRVKVAIEAMLATEPERRVVALDS